MKYVPPINSSAPNAGYSDPVDGTVPAAAVEQPMREIASVIASMGIVPSESDLTQLDQAIDLKVAAVQPDLSELVSREELRNSGFVTREELARYVAFEKYDLCEFYYFRNPALRPGFQAAEGILVENASTLYPDAWAFLQTGEGRRLCVPEEEWQNMSRAVWATLADGAQVGWNGVGGVPFYVQDTATGSLRLPDLRGMYAEASGFDDLGVGGAHGDAGRQLTGFLASGAWNHTSFDTFAGILYGSGYAVTTAETGTKQAAPHAGQPAGWGYYRGCTLDSSRQIPSANKIQPRAWGALACVYLGRPTA